MTSVPRSRRIPGRTAASPNHRGHLDTCGRTRGTVSGVQGRPSQTSTSGLGTRPATVSSTIVHCDSAAPIDGTRSAASTAATLAAAPARACSCLHGLPCDRARGRRAAIHVCAACWSRSSACRSHRAGAPESTPGSGALRSRATARARTPAPAGEPAAYLLFRSSSSTLTRGRRQALSLLVVV